MMNQEITLRSYQVADRRWVVASNINHYEDCEGFDKSFAGAVHDAVAKLERQLSDPRSKYIIVEDTNRRIGCIFFSPECDEIGRVRLFYLDREFRGRGLGRRMVSSVVGFARQVGFSTIRVSTFDRHRAACGLYKSLGFVAVKNGLVHAFGQDMVQLDFELTL